MSQTSESERIIKLMLCIREAGSLSFTAIRDALPAEYGMGASNAESARRRFERDKKTLQEHGVFLTIDENQCYALDLEKTVAAPINLTKPQVSLVRLVCGALLEDKEYPLKSELRMVLVKLGDELELPDMLPQVNSRQAATTSKSYDHQGFSKIKKAINARKRLSFTYINARGLKSQRKVEPFGMFLMNHVCYVAAYDPSIQDERVFRLGRMTNLRINSSNPKAPDFDERPFDVTNHFGLPFQFGDENYQARVCFEGAALSRVQQLTMGLGKLTHHGKSCEWSVTCKNTLALTQWCIENGPGITVLEPHQAHQAYLSGVQTFLDCVAQGVHDGQ